jgi:tripartite-type tricarboxylate transporter receptor subunit TctC
MMASSYTVVPAPNPKLPYDPERDLAPIVMVAKNSLLFLVNLKVPAQSLAEFVALAALASQANGQRGNSIKRARRTLA